MGKVKGNLVVGQSGGPTVVINSSLSGVIQEAMAQSTVGEIYGMYRGIRGLLKEEFIDLRRQPAGVVEGLRHTPGAALGTVRYRLSEADYDRILDVLKKHNIRYLHYIGGNDSSDTSCTSSPCPRRWTTTWCTPITAPVTRVRRAL